MSKEVGGRGVWVNTLSPGPVSTALWLGEHGVAATRGREGGVDPKEVAARAAAEMVTGRFTRPEELADLVVPLASDRTGHGLGLPHRRRSHHHAVMSRGAALRTRIGDSRSPTA